MRTLVKTLLGIGVLAIGGCVAGLSFLALAQPEAVTLPPPTGTHAVGRIRFDWRDPDRIDPLAPEGGMPRELPVWIWYPASRDASAPGADYLPDELIARLDDAAVPLLKATVGWLATSPRNVRSHALDAPAVAEGRFPVLLMRPARGGLAPQYATLAEDLASHGYVVVGADMPYTTRVVVYGDGRRVRRTETGAPPELAPGRRSPLAPGLPNDLFLPVLDVLVADGTFLLDELAALDSSGRQFAGRLDLGKVGAFGHSVGGTVALELCAVEPRCTAAIDIDGYLMGSVAETGLGKPFLFLASDRPIFRRPAEELDDAERELLDALARIRNGLPNPLQLVVVEGMGHYSFVDSALLNSPALGRLSGATIDAERGLAVTREHVRTFFDVYLKGRPAALLTDLGQRFPEARAE